MIAANENGILEMPLNAVGWSTEEDEKLAELVKPHPYLYSVFDPSRKNILARETTWKEIAQELLKPVEECKKRWRGLRDGFMRSKRVGALHKTKVSVFEKLQFLDGMVLEDPLDNIEITVVDHSPEATQTMQPFIKIIPEVQEKQEPPKKIRKAGRKKAIPVPKNIPPIKILPKPIVLNSPKLVRYVEDPKVSETKSQAIDNLIEKVLKENTNEIDVFFRSMAASVKKLQPNLIPKVKMEVCNVIAKYEMQSFDKNLSNQ